MVSICKGKPLCVGQANLLIFGSYPKLWLMVPQRSKLRSYGLLGLGLGGRLCGEEVNFRRVPIPWSLFGELVFKEAKLCVSLVHRGRICSHRKLLCTIAMDEANFKVLWCHV